MNIEQVMAIVDRCNFPGYEFLVWGDFNRSPGPTYLQARFLARCATTGLMEPQFTRKWMLSKHMTTSEIVQTVFKCVLTAVEHEAREQFTYRAQAIFGPHFDIEALVQMQLAGMTEVRYERSAQ
jgi:hypothetical protein